MIEKECKEVLFKQKNYEDQRDHEKNSFPWLLYFSGFTANLLLIAPGFLMVWMSSAMPKLLSNDTNINPLGEPISVPQTSILASIPAIAGTLGLLPWANLIDILGRKKTLMVLAIIMFCNSIVVSFASHISFFYCQGFITGFTGSGVLICVSIFNNEIAAVTNRGTIGCLMGLSAPSGILLGYLIGPAVSIRGYFLFSTIPPALHLIFSVFIPESPVFLAMKDRKLECMRALERLRAIKNAKTIENEYDKMETVAKDASKQRKGNFLDIFRNRSPRKAFFMCFGIAAIQQFSGVYVILLFMGTIFANAGKISGGSFGIVTGIVQLFMVLISAIVVDKLGRRPLLLTSTMSCAIALFLLGFYFHLQQMESAVVDSLTWLPISCVLLYIIGYGFGLGPIPPTLSSELFPNDLRAIGCATVYIADHLTICATMLTFPLASAFLGVQYCMWFFSMSCFLGFIMIFFVLPETKGKSFDEIQEILAH
ncbi:unnamed protein product [Psylliodes chrysocephalus]|uniref:Major facilitator superfamily (MFS) profile domain-containing protein n=1 Tax=Psylliodes chrysocephalus TaxID=3402493 RepID=A0A9P0GIK9_9CUCU|nr:unnamed protein product [Psylliodes chrysocephala]